MRAGVLLWAALAAAPAAAQFQLSVPEGDIERPVGAQYDFGVVPAGDVREVRFRVRNVSSGPAALNFTPLSGPAFTTVTTPELPAELGSGSAVEFTVQFHPPATGLYSTALSVGNLSPILRGRGRAGLDVFLDMDGTLVPLTSASTILFPDVERNSTGTRRIVARNATAEPIATGGISVSGEYFRLGPQLPPESLGPGEQAVFEVSFHPESGGERAGLLVVDERRITLEGTTVEPPLPAPVIVADPTEIASAQQAKLSIRFDEARTNGAGRVTLEFQPAAEEFPADPAIIFPSTNSASAEFTVIEGRTSAVFGTQEQIEFQTGTTAGTLVIKVELGSHTESMSFPIAAAPPGIDSVRGTRSASSIEVQISGFDNTRTASQLSFTFYDRTGAVIGAGPLRADPRAAFEEYFKSSEVGGMFSLRAVFPVTGDTSGIGGFEVEITNSAGTAKSARTSF